MAINGKPRVRVKVGDGFTNLVANLGTSRDKAASGTWLYQPSTLTEIDALYRGTWLGRKIIDIPVGDMTREWRVFRADGEVVSRIEAEEKRLQIKAKVAQAVRWANLYGGAVLILGDGAADPSQPLDLSAIRAGGLKFVHPLTRYQIGYRDIDLDPFSGSYGDPEFWDVSGMGRIVQVHHSRVIKIIGAERPPTIGVIDPWGDSVYDAMRSAIMNSDTASAAMASLLVEAKIDVITIPDLQTHLQTPEGEARMMRRFNLAAMLKGINGMLLMGGGEVYGQKTFNFAGLPDVHSRLLQEVSGAADIPLTRLLGQTPGGLQSTGENDIRNYYDGISSKQEDVLRPILDRIDALLIPSALGAAKADLWWEFNELWQLSEKDQSDIFARAATAIKTLADAALVPDAALAQSAVALLDGEGMLPGLAKAVDEFSAGAPDDGLDDDPGTDALDIGDGFNPDQPREPAGTAEGGQWRAMGQTAKTDEEIQQARLRHMEQAHQAEDAFFQDFSREEYSVNIDNESSGGSVYLKLFKHPIKKDGARMKSRSPFFLVKIRFADHPQFYGAGISVDPYSGNTVSDAVAMMRYKANRAKYPPPVIGHARIDPGSGLWKHEGTRLYRDYADDPGTDAGV